MQTLAKKSEELREAEVLLQKFERAARAEKTERAIVQKERPREEKPPEELQSTHIRTVVLLGLLGSVGENRTFSFEIWQHELAKYERLELTYSDPWYVDGMDDLLRIPHQTLADLEQLGLVRIKEHRYKILGKRKGKYRVLRLRVNIARQCELTDEGSSAFAEIKRTKDLYQLLHVRKSIAQRLGVHPKRGWAKFD